MTHLAILILGLPYYAITSQTVPADLCEKLKQQYIYNTGHNASCIYYDPKDKPE